MPLPWRLCACCEKGEAVYTGGVQMKRYDKEFWEMLDALVHASEIVIDRPKGTVEEEKMVVYQAHNETQYMKGIMIRR